jgi:enoyl-CoA hydratase/carnithine racemase
MEQAGDESIADNLVQYETDGNVAIVTMNRPAKLNAVSAD